MHSGQAESSFENALGNNEHPMDADSGMCFISRDFDIVMANRASQLIYKKPLGSLLGKKCFREFEKREEVCPSCPGAAALQSGRPETSEREGIRDDGTSMAVAITAYPVLDQTSSPIGFIEVEQDITDRKKADRAALAFGEFDAAIRHSGSLKGALRHALDCALALDGIDCGCALVLDPSTGTHEAAASRGFPAEYIETHRRRRPEPVQAPGKLSNSFSRLVEYGACGSLNTILGVRVYQARQVVAELLLGSRYLREFPPATAVSLTALGLAMDSTYARLQADSHRQSAASFIRTLVAALPSPVWCVDQEQNVTSWNSAAESLFGWRESELLGKHLPLISAANKTALACLHSVASPAGCPDEFRFECEARSGKVVRVSAWAMPLNDLLGNARQTIVVARQLPSRQSQLAESHD